MQLLDLTLLLVEVLNLLDCRDLGNLLVQGDCSTSVEVSVTVLALAEKLLPRAVKVF